jgi:8-oxo-dGTP diphosphatase
MIHVIAAQERNLNIATANWPSCLAASMTAATTAYDLHVAAGVLIDLQGRILIAQRPRGVPFAGAWEFPGGKIGAAELPLQALVRELDEELNVRVRYARHLVRYSHIDEGRRIYLYVWRVLKWLGEPSGAEGQALRWLPVHELMVEGLLPADEHIVNCLSRTVAVNTCKDFSAVTLGEIL